MLLICSCHTQLQILLGETLVSKHNSVVKTPVVKAGGLGLDSQWLPQTQSGEVIYT